MFPTLEADGLQATATFGPAGQHFCPVHLPAAAQGRVPLLPGQRRVLAELIRLLAPFPALRHQLSILQQKIQAAELGNAEGAILQGISTHTQQGVTVDSSSSSFNMNANKSSGVLLVW